MARIETILQRKGTDVLTAEPTARVLDAALLMNEHRVGAVVVTQAGRVVGMFTERDVLRRVVAKCADPAALTLNEVMTRDVVTTSPADSVEEARTTFMDRRIRHLPVVDSDGTLRGLVSIGDLNAYELSGQKVRVQALEEYLYGGAA